MIAKDKELASDNLLVELKEIIIERDDLVKDRFHRLIEESYVLDIEGPLSMEDFFAEVSGVLSRTLSLSDHYLYTKFIKREKESSTVVRKGLAIPHIIIEGENIFKIMLIRAKRGIVFTGDEVVHIAFVLVSSSDQRNLHLKVLAAIAQITSNIDFDRKWMNAVNTQDLKDMILLSERRRDVYD